MVSKKIIFAAIAVVLILLFVMKSMKKKKLEVKSTHGNNGSVSCERYCQGINGSSWNGELPHEWNGAKCVGTETPGTDCLSTGKPVKCQCSPTGAGWKTN
jgi:hypothetical protein